MAHGPGLLAGGQELHRADDVELLHRRTPTGGARRRDDAHVHHGVDVLPRDHLRDDGVADVGAHEAHVTEVLARWHHVDADDALDVVVGGERARKPSTEVRRDPGHQDDASHPQPTDTRSEPGLLALTAALDARALEQLAVLLLGHALAALLDDRTHGGPFQN